MPVCRVTRSSPQGVLSMIFIHSNILNPVKSCIEPRQTNDYILCAKTYSISEKMFDRFELFCDLNVLND